MKAAIAALLVAIVATIVRAIGAVTSSNSVLQTYLIKANNSLSKSKRHKHYVPGDHQLLSDIHATRTSSVVQAIIVGVIFTILILSLRKARSASGSRWVLLLVGFVTGVFGGVIPIHGYPTIPNVANVIAGVVSLGAVGLMFSPPSARYFKACRDAVMPPELRAQARPGLFGQRRGAGSAGAGARPGMRSAQTRSAQTRPAQTRPVRPASSTSASGKARAKVRADTEAVARGAELARSRAKASKSRRTDG
jgi:hypothetical protein